MDRWKYDHDTLQVQAFVKSTLPHQYPFLAADRDISYDFRAAACGAVNRESPTNLFRALTHANQSEMTRPSIARHLIVKTAPVISYDELHSPGIEY